MMKLLAEITKIIVRISTTHNGVFAINANFDSINNNSVKIVLDDNYPSDVKDFKSYLTKVRNIKNLDAIFINLMPGQLGIFAKQVREFGIELPMFDVELFEDKNEIKNSNGALIGQWYVTVDEPEDGMLKRYRQKYQESSSYAAAHGYDIVMHFLNAYKQNLKGEQIAEYFEKLNNYQGALGTYSSTSDHRFTIPAAVKIVENDGFRKISSNYSALANLERSK